MSDWRTTKHNRGGSNWIGDSVCRGPNCPDQDKSAGDTKSLTDEFWITCIQELFYKKSHRPSYFLTLSPTFLYTTFLSNKRETCSSNWSQLQTIKVNSTKRKSNFLNNWKSHFFWVSAKLRYGPQKKFFEKNEKCVREYSNKFSKKMKNVCGNIHLPSQLESQNPHIAKFEESTTRKFGEAVTKINHKTMHYCTYHY